MPPRVDALANVGVRARHIRHQIWPGALITAHHAVLSSLPMHWQLLKACIRSKPSNTSPKSALHLFTGLSVGQHLLAAYLKSLRAVLRVQFTHKGLRGGRSGVARLVEESTVVQVAHLEFN